ncbi:MAG: pyrimidine dimer DNA glycosylase/endonuclease V [Elusimicrobiota bacterium]|nr:pyrimidine dimer DNA glycosylase/endonuclease V [Elusimicrobiota bacterium]
MRIWDIPAGRLCRNHLLGEHRELHCIWVVLTRHKTGYSRHPETLRWRGRLKALFLRHEELAAEMSARGYRHKSPLAKRLATGRAVQDRYLNTPREQLALLKAKKCGCRTGPL